MSDPKIPRASTGDDIMVGDKYTNFFYGSLGADSMDGKEGVDRLRYTDSPSAVQVNLSTGIGKDGHAEGDTYINIEDIWGSRFDDILIGDEQDNKLDGHSGSDFIDGKGGIDTLTFAYSLGVEVNLKTGVGKGGIAEGDSYANIENINGSRYNDILIGDDNDNYIYGKTGDDKIDGGKGNDEFLTLEHDIISGGEGIDILNLSAYYNHATSPVTILKDENKIMISSKNIQYGVVEFDSIEIYKVTENDETKTVDVKEIWSDLLAEEQAKFLDESDFLNWLGNDAGYNYEGL